MAGRMGFCVWGLFWTPLSISPWVSQLRICCCGCHWTLWTTDWGFWGKGQSWRLLDAAAAVHIYSVCRTPFPVFMYISVHKSTLTKRGDMCIVEWNQLSNLVSTFPHIIHIHTIASPPLSAALLGALNSWHWWQIIIASPGWSSVG